MNTNQSQDIVKTLNDFAINAIDQLKPVVKGFAPSLSYELINDDNLTELKIYGHQYILTLIYGRAPTKSGASKGNPSLKEVILDWVRRHSITFKDAKGGNLKDEVVAFLISRKIHREGTLLYRKIQNGQQPTNIFETVIGAKNIEDLKNDIANDFLSLISYKLIEI